MDQSCLQITKIQTFGPNNSLALILVRSLPWTIFSEILNIPLYTKKKLRKNCTDICNEETAWSEIVGESCYFLLILHNFFKLADLHQPIFR